MTVIEIEELIDLLENNIDFDVRLSADQTAYIVALMREKLGKR